MCRMTLFLMRFAHSRSRSENDHSLLYDFITLLEANAAGKPVVASYVGGIPSVVRDGVNGLLVPPCDEKTLAKTVINLLRDEDKLLEIGRNGRRIAEGHDWKQIAKKTEELYREVLADS